MACATITLFSRVLSLSVTVDLVFCEGKARAVQLAEPTAADEAVRASTGVRNAPPPREAFPVLYLLHGGDGDNTSWRRNVALERLAADSGLAIAMPSVQHSFYTNQKAGYAWFDFLADELPLSLRDYLNISVEREDSFAAGLSMGGYGAFKLGILRPDRYAAVASLSGSLDQSRRLTPDSDLKNPVMQRLAYLAFGSRDDYVGGENDLFAGLERALGTVGGGDPGSRGGLIPGARNPVSRGDLIPGTRDPVLCGDLIPGRGDPGSRLPAFYMACGADDGNVVSSDAFHARFADRVDLFYDRTAGAAHGWDYWDSQFPKVLAWLAGKRRAIKELKP